MEISRIVHVTLQYELICGGAGSATNSPSLESKLIGREVRSLKEHHLVLVCEIKLPSSVAHETEMKRLYTDCGSVTSVVGGGIELGATEAGLVVEDRRIGDSHFN